MMIIREKRQAKTGEQADNDMVPVMETQYV